tara:strand:+ start:38 stop:799 length:762 start_codon:yes stop_codon:yes gene_type:complete
LIKSKKLHKQKKISHGFFDKKGGKSSGIYSSLNCGLGSNDNKNKVKENLKIVKNKICKNSEDIFLTYQAHSKKFFFVNKKHKLRKKIIKADAIITDQKLIPIGVVTADCVPILIYENKKNMIAAVHAGWKGAFKGIIKSVINFMLKKGCRTKNIIAAIGPCIQQNNYKVGSEFKEKFLKKYKNSKIFFKMKKNTIYFSLPNFIKSQLKSLKIDNIDTIKIDTFDKKNNFFSARRSLQLKQADYGRNISIIMIN